MQSLLPEQLDFLQKAKAGLEIRGRWPIAKLPRLVESIESDTGDLEAHLVFGQQGRLYYLRGEVSAEVGLICQRCMEPMTIKLDTEFKLAMISDESYLDRVPSSYEPLIVGDGKKDIAEMLEDELLLVMPLVPRHEQECSEYMQHQAQKIKDDAELAEQEKAQNNPFSALKDLL